MKKLTLLNGKEISIKEIFQWDFYNNKIDVELKYDEYIGYNLKYELLESLKNYIYHNSYYSTDDYNQHCDGFIPYNPLKRAWDGCDHLNDCNLKIKFRDKEVNVSKIITLDDFIKYLEQEPFPVLKEGVDYDYKTEYDEDGNQYLAIIPLKETEIITSPSDQEYGYPVTRINKVLPITWDDLKRAYDQHYEIVGYGFVGLINNDTWFYPEYSSDGKYNHRQVLTSNGWVRTDKLDINNIIFITNDEKWCWVPKYGLLRTRLP